jgi:hypothetical protein
VFENSVLGRLFGPKIDEVRGGWRKLHNEKLRSLYSSPSIIKVMKSRSMRWAGHVVWVRRNTHIISVGMPEEKRPPETTRCRWVDNIKMDLGETEWGGMDWIVLPQDRDKWRALVKAVKNCREVLELVHNWRSLKVVLNSIQLVSLLQNALMVQF